MSEKLTPKHAPYTAQELVDCGWVDRVRSAVLKDDHAVRLGPFRTVQAQVINHPEDWRNIQLPNGGVELVDLKECILVVAMLDGTIPIPESLAKP